MAKKRRRHSAEFKQQAVRLVIGEGYTVAQAAQSRVYQREFAANLEAATGRIHQRRGE